MLTHKNGGKSDIDTPEYNYSSSYLSCSWQSVEFKNWSALHPRLPLFPSVEIVLIKEGKKEFFP